VRACTDERSTQSTCAVMRRMDDLVAHLGSCGTTVLVIVSARTLVEPARVSTMFALLVSAALARRNFMNRTERGLLRT
jgi:hypothetical protein